MVRPAQSRESASAQRDTLADTQCAQRSPRQRAIRRTAARGLTTAAIARQLGMQPSTVTWHCAQISQRIGVPNRTAAVWYAREHKLLDEHSWHRLQVTHSDALSSFPL